jgi:hypothetical protein
VKVSLTDQIKVIESNIHRVGFGHKNPIIAELWAFELERLEAVLETLRGLEEAKEETP